MAWGSTFVSDLIFFSPGLEVESRRPLRVFQKNRLGDDGFDGQNLPRHNVLKETDCAEICMDGVVVPDFQSRLKMPSCVRLNVRAFCKSRGDVANNGAARVR